jgi:cytochrome c biogenesis protein
MSLSESSREHNQVWRFFSSVRLAMVLLIILAVVSIAGTLIPQRQDALEFTRHLAPGTLRLFMTLDLFNLYHSIWFRLLIGMLALNLVICSIDRFPAIRKRIGATPRPDRLRPFQDLPAEQCFITTMARENAITSVEQYFRKRYRYFQAKESDGSYFLYGEKGRLTHFGFYLIHLSILIIIVGAILGSIFGFEAFVNILEGETVNSATYANNRGTVPLGFDIRCDRFSVDFYKNGTPKEYRSELTFLNNGKVILHANARVNHPVRFRGITFYQASYGSVAGNRVGLKIRKSAGTREATTVLEMQRGEPSPLPGAEAHFEVDEIRDNFMNMGPAVLIRVQPDQGAPTSFWVFRDQEDIQKRFPGLEKQFGKLNPSAYKPFTFALDHIETRYYTGLQVNKDPGVPLVWTGCFFMVAGFFVAFFMSHRRIWIRISTENGGTGVSIAGRSSKNPVGLQRELVHLTHSLEEQVTGKGLKA